jgi:hypothetical protein
VTEVGVLQRIFLTSSLTVNQWLTCAGVAVALLGVEEAVKLALRWREKARVVAPVAGARRVAAV